jgi:tetraacyldisaccharide 4'-kinase
LITTSRNYLFDAGILKSTKFEIPIINIGNIRVGGTGKTPHVEYLIEKLKSEFKIATLSRGYGRETRGFEEADEDCDARLIGDEPLQLFKKYGSEVKVTVCEDRVLAVPEILKRHSNTNLILLDDAFQHRYIKPSLNILLTTFQNPFYKDFLLPSGLLRESAFSSKRADIIIVSKCPNNLTENENEKDKISRIIRTFAGRKNSIYFSSIGYKHLVAFNEGEYNLEGAEVLLVSGLANAKNFREFVTSKFNVQKEMHFKDHYDFYSYDIETIIKWLENHANGILICSEKDYVKLNDQRFSKLFGGKKAFYLPIEVIIENEVEFIEEVKSYIQ